MTPRILVIGAVALPAGYATYTEFELFKAEDVADFDLVILAPPTAKDGVTAIGLIRQSPVLSVYLTPVYLAMDVASLEEKQLAETTDGLALPNYASETLRNQWLAEAKTINDRIASIKNTVPDTSLPLKLLRMAYTRKMAYTPALQGRAKFGYRYPKCSPFFGVDDWQAFSVLDVLGEHQVMASTFHDKVHTCPACDASSLNFRETCPKCGSANLKNEDLVHHYRCGYSGPESDFIDKNGEMTCPKCGHSPSQIGVDHDRPGVVAVCASCGHTSQEPGTQAVCFSCGTVSKVDQLGQKDILIWSLTPIASGVAIHGMASMLSTAIGGQTGMVDLATFNFAVGLEQTRIARYKKTQSCAMLMDLNGIESAYLSLGAKSAGLHNEVASVIRGLLRKSDVLSSISGATFIVLLTETPLSGADVLAGRLVTALTEIAKANLPNIPLPRVVVRDLVGLAEGQSAISLF